jgi:hypothetical protein
MTEKLNEWETFITSNKRLSELVKKQGSLVNEMEAKLEKAEFKVNMLNDRLANIQEIFKELLKLSKEDPPRHPHSYRDSSTDWDDLCEDESWYHTHFDQIRELLERIWKVTVID